MYSRSLKSVIFITAMFFTFFLAAAHSAKAEGHVCPPGGGTSEDPGCSASATLHLSGVVTVACAIEIEADPRATELDIKAGENNTLVATASIEANGEYEVSVQSANGGSLKNGLVAGDEGVPYQLSYAGGNLIAPTTEAQMVKESGPVAGAQSSKDEIRVTFAGKPDAAPGTYSDDLTFTVSAL